MSDAKTGRRATDNPTVLRPAGEWRKFDRGVYRCMVYLTPEDDGRFAVEAATLPGVASQGDSEKEALSNVVEALEGVIGSYRELGMPIPWLATAREPIPGSKTRWVVVHA